MSAIAADRPSTTPPRTRRTVLNRANRMKAVFLIPALIIFGVVVLVPVFVNFFYSFTDWNGYTSGFDLVGGDNFLRLLGDVDVQKAFVNTLLFTVVNAPIQIAVGLVLALSLQRPGRFVAFIRLVVVLPIAISGVVLGFLGSIVFDPRSGILHTLGTVPGLSFLDRNWLGDPSLAMGSVIAMNLWQWSGFTMLIFLAGLAAIPRELYEAATLDGAGVWRQFRHVTWPLLAPAATINIVLTVIGGLKIFDIIYVLTGGGPGGATESIVMRVNAQTSFSQYGYAASTSFTLTIIILAVSLGLLALLRKREINA